MSSVLSISTMLSLGSNPHLCSKFFRNIKMLSFFVCLFVWVLRGYFFGGEAIG